MKGDIVCWDEFTPHLYEMVLRIENVETDETDTYTARFGFRDIKVVDGKLMLNGRPLFLRGTLDAPSSR